MEGKKILVAFPVEEEDRLTLEEAAPGCQFRFAKSDPGLGRFESLVPGEPLTQELADWGQIILGTCPRGCSTAGRTCCGCRPTAPGWRPT